MNSAGSSVQRNPNSEGTACETSERCEDSGNGLEAILVTLHWLCSVCTLRAPMRQNSYGLMCSWRNCQGRKAVRLRHGCRLSLLLQVSRGKNERRRRPLFNVQLREKESTGRCKVTAKAGAEKESVIAEEKRPALHGTTCKTASVLNGRELLCSNGTA